MQFTTKISDKKIVVNVKRLVYFFFYYSMSTSPQWGGDSLFVVGERMIVSRQDGRGWGVATGYIKQLHTTTIDIVVNK